MKCERCGDNTHVGQHEIDGFTGHLCKNCTQVWDEILGER